MKKTLILIISIFLFVNYLSAKKITQTQAVNVAKNLIYEQTGVFQSQIIVQDVLLKKYQESLVYYIINIQYPEGFVIISANDNVLPILAYSFDGNYLSENQPPQFIAWMQNYQKQINYVVEYNIEATEEINNKWNKYNSNPENFVFTKTEKSVEPLLDPIVWNQGAGWNAECPEDPDGSGGHVYAGCVATATGMVMKYYDYPAQGEGSHGYNSSYGYLEANFGETEYHFENMSDTESTDEAALLLYHIGIAVEMNYSPNGSGAYTSDAVESMNEYFKYSSTYYFAAKEDYEESVWIEMLKNNLDRDMPLIYRGYGPDGGHAFCCDGYDNSDLFHFNWGWSGSHNGFFEIDNLNPGSYTFSEDCGAGLGVIPAPEDLEPVQNIEFEQPNYNEINLAWDPPATKDILSSYRIYRNGLIIADLETTQTTFNDILTEEDTYYYGVKAVYDNSNGGESSCELMEVFIETSCNITFIVTDEGTQAPIRNASVTFMGETEETNLGGVAVFSDIPFDTDEFDYTIDADGYFETEGQTDIAGSHDVNIALAPNSSNISKINSTFKIVPNPTSDFITITNFNEQLFELYITNTNGKLIYKNNNLSNNYLIDLSEYNSGIYLLQIKTETEIINKKIILIK